MTTSDDVLRVVRKEFHEDLEIKVIGNDITVSFNKWVPSEEFADVAESLKSLGAEWISAGKESRFLLHISKAVVGSATNMVERIDQILYMLNTVTTELKTLKETFAVSKPS